jgi:hypothetical protein
MGVKEGGGGQGLAPREGPTDKGRRKGRLHFKLSQEIIPTLRVCVEGGGGWGAGPAAPA